MTVVILACIMWKTQTNCITDGGFNQPGVQPCRAGPRWSRRVGPAVEGGFGRPVPRRERAENGYAIVVQ